jgi:hypothetical protein
MHAFSLSPIVRHMHIFVYYSVHSKAFKAWAHKYCFPLVLGIISKQFSIDHLGREIFAKPSWKILTLISSKIDI